MSQQAPARRPGGPMGGGGPMGFGMGVSDAKAQDFRGSIKRFSARLRPERWLIVLVLVLASTSVFLAVLGPKLLGNATNVIFEGVVGKQLPDGRQPGAGRRRPRGLGPIRPGRHAGRDDGDAGPGRRLLGAGPDPRARRGRLRPELGAVVGAELPHGRRHPAHHVPAARGHRHQARPAAAALLRLRLPRRRPQPRHERHRQHREHPAADAHPAHHVGADGHRRAGDDVLDQSAAGRHLPADRPAVVLGHDGHRQAIPAALRGAVEVDRRPERPCRGDLHGPRPRQGVRPSTRVDRPVRRRQRAHVREQLQGAVHLRHHPAGHHRGVEPQLRRHRRDRRAFGWHRARCPSATCRRSSSTPASSRCRSPRSPPSRTSCSPGSPRWSGCSSCSTSPRRSPTWTRRCRSTPSRAASSSTTSRSATCRTLR